MLELSRHPTLLPAVSFSGSIQWIPSPKILSGAKAKDLEGVGGLKNVPKKKIQRELSGSLTTLYAIQGKPIEPIFESLFPQNEGFRGVCGASLHKHPYF